MNGEQISENGFAVIEDVFSTDEVNSIIALIDRSEFSNPNFKKGNDLFAIRQFLKEVPTAASLIFTERFNSIVSQLFGDDYFVVKSIYFDKPPASNWFVAYHQDLTISVDRRDDLNGFVCWTVKQGQFAVQPPIEILQRNFTVRIHLDDTDVNNGALKVISRSHVHGVVRQEHIYANRDNEVICEVLKGGIMIMKPLLLHASGRTTDQRRRRVIHIEFSNTVLPEPLQWSERIERQKW